ncbi:MAG: hypothetical protein AB8B96_01785 [Lysobacterales bacterium]
MTQSVFLLPSTLGRRFALLMLSLFFIVGGVNHFIQPQFYLNIMPPYLPWPMALIWISGVLEIAGGIGVLLHRFRSMSGVLLVLVIIAVTPANIHMAMNPELYPGIRVWLLYIRLPLQLLIIWWAWWATRLPQSTAS